MAVHLTSLASVITVVGRIRIVARRWVRRVIFLLFSTLFLIVAFLFLQWKLWKWWVWVQVIQYICVSILLWKFCWLCQYSWFWVFCSDWNLINWWRCSVVCVENIRSRVQIWSTHINICRVQSWSTHRNISPLKILNFSHSFKITF